MLEVTIEQDRDVTILGLHGELDSQSAPEVREQLLNAVHSDSKIVLDMSNVSYMSSAGLRVLLLLYRRIRENVGQIVVTGLHDEVRDVMAITGFLDFFVTAKSRREAIMAMS
ncbi:MAG: anti-sigma factor antagonist [Anaerolineaceae bacterium]|nr:MAG: anti-sigma factor antagonist [Anaerolineaceae bacterium]